MKSGTAGAGAVAAYGVLVVFVALSLGPLLVMGFDALKTTTEMARNPAGIPREPTMVNLAYLVAKYPGGVFVRSVFNSILVSTGATLLSLFFASLAAYAFAKIPFRGRKVLFALLIATMILPVEITIPPLYILFARIHWLNSYKVQIIPFAASVFSLFMLRQYLMAVPDSLIEAARMEGASHGRIFATIIAPLCTPVLSVLAVLNFMGRFNDYFWPVIMVNTAEFKPVMTVLPTIATDANSMFPPSEYLMAGCALITLPVLIVFLAFRSSFMKGASLGVSVKE
ncbi:MAG TPA: carbohydrate ABC transporter permease [Spirochaetia bacterium]|nr:carbohydrate ABC transporter permease [Spirochaetia bacterium]